MKKLFNTQTLILSLFLFFAIILSNSLVFAQETNSSRQKAEILSFEENVCPDQTDTNCFFYKVKLLGIDKGREIEIVEPEHLNFGSQVKYGNGDIVFVEIFQIKDEISYSISGHVRENAILILVILFIFVTLLIGGIKGFGSLIGLAVSVFTIFGITTPLIIKGFNPYIAGTFSVIFILVSSIYLSHGFNKRSTIALLSSIIGLFITAVIAGIFLSMANITGLGNEEAFYLVTDFNQDLNMTSVVFVSILIGGIGIIDDVAVNQVVAMNEILKNNPSISQIDLFKSAMSIGKDHISSMVNTLFIAYTASSMALVMIMQARNINFLEIINDEFFAEEIIRTIVASIGLILVVPITSYIASFLLTRKNQFGNKGASQSSSFGIT